jgi:hypothetical protein
LAYLSTKNIWSYVEIECRYGGTFIIVVEYHRRFNELYLAAALDIEYSEVMAAYAKRTIGIEYRIINDHNPEAVSYLGSMRWNLAFVDGDHSYEGCFSDFQAVRGKASIIGLHDITSDACPGVVRAWQKIKRAVPANRLFEATGQYLEVRDRTARSFLGIGLVDFS